MSGPGPEVAARNDTGHLTGHLTTTLGMGNRTMFPARGMFSGGDGVLRVRIARGVKRRRCVAASIMRRRR
jgi:hypothetical protein